MSAIQMRWRVPPKVLADSLERHGDKVFVAIMAVSQRFAVELQNESRDTARWEDRTGNARSGLFSFARQFGRDTVTIYLSHGHAVEYGVYLELAHGGRYAVIMPTIQRLIPELKRSLDAVFGR